ncbi:Phragmoplast orienting kinesin 2 [Morella rubra]|uniref:Phragmoplast orienting kinesin 2 n=1 Tax=Morella rubra TaxID=262757 RepID=A0A6A1WQJ8_9ROSI|nr:Phragmoplast orienting kinesin 2 [Morella rubra]
MPFISDTASAIKSRFGFQDHSSVDSVPLVRSSPYLPKSASKENLAQSSSAVRSISNWDAEDGGNSGSVVSSSQSFEFCDDPSFWKDHNVQVIIRIRPLSSTEISLQGYSKCVRQESYQTITWTGHPESRFTFDIVADENVSQEKLFKVAGLPMVENCMGGYNSCMFAYGQTGSGKTHTMLGDIEGGTRRHSVNCGMTPRVFEHLFSRMQKLLLSDYCIDIGVNSRCFYDLFIARAQMQLLMPGVCMQEKDAQRDEKLRYTCKCSFLEIYNEQILDLLDPSSCNLQIREDSKKGVYVENLKEIEVTSARDVIQQLIQGAANRKVAATNMNHASSRSHSVFTCIIESKWESQGVTHHRFARLNLVDLAGSERQKSSGAEGERLKEATNINKSLSTLGLVIMNLVNMSNGKSLHVPYRDSKLTFLLQDSLGGNSKTTIIANISPSSCCSLETLSTLKFAQRAKFIKNNAIVNEDASGDVIAMRLQIQQLKKEVSRLRSLVGGAENQANDSLAASFPGSPGSFNWEGLHASSSPLTSGKRTSRALTAENKAAVQLAKQREDEIQGLKMRLRFREDAIKRLEAVASGKILIETHILKEKEEHLREIEVLRAQVDRNQEVTRFAMENLRLKEEIRRTRAWMPLREASQVSGSVIGLKSFYEEGERETMNEQIMVLQNKLLEALDWKLMHELDPSIVQKANSMEQVQGDDSLLSSNQESRSTWRSSVSEENEFLRVQAIQNQAELDTLQKKLEFCIEEKEKLERHVNDLAAKLENERTFRASKEGTQQVELPSVSTNIPIFNFNDQMELKTMVDAIAAASQREAVAHETAIMLSKENDELRMKLKVLIEDNNRLIELYERAAAESDYNSTNKPEKAEEGGTEIHNRDGFIEHDKEKETEMNKVVENLEHQLTEINEENEKLMGLYERAMQERDELKRMLSSCGRERVETKLEFDCPEKLVEVDGMDPIRPGEPPMSFEGRDLNVETALQGLSLHDRSYAFEKPTISGGKEVLKVENYYCGINPQVGSGIGLGNSQLVTENQPDSQEDACLESDGFRCFFGANTSMEESRGLVEPIISGDVKVSSENTGMSSPHSLGCQADSANETDVGTVSNRKTNTSNFNVASEDLDLVRMKLARADEQLLDSARNINKFGSLEKAISEVDKLSRNIEEVEGGLKDKRQQYESLQLTASEMRERKIIIDRKLSALKYSIANFSSSVVYFEQREARARLRVISSTSYLGQKKQKLACLQIQKDEIETAHGRLQQSEVELRNNLVCLKSKLLEEDQKKENEKVFFATNNVEKIEPSQKIWNLGCKATELLKSEEEKTKLQTEIKLSQERLGAIRREAEDLNSNYEKVESEMQAVQADILKGIRSVEEMELALQGVIQEKEMLMEIKQNGKTEIEKMILEYQQHVFEADLKEFEMRIVEEELQMELIKIEELQTVRSTVMQQITRSLEGTRCHSLCLSEEMEKELQNVRASLLEASSLLAEGK